MTLKEYYLSYKGLLGLLAALVTCSPLLALIPVDVVKYIFPPLGIVNLIARVISVLAAIAATFAVYFWKPRKVTRAISILIGGFFFSAIIYTVAFLISVRSIEIPSERTSVMVSVGYYRSGFALNNFANFSDEQMLTSRGPNEEEIRRCWTLSSIIAARMVLWLTCTISLVSLAAAFGLGIIASKDRSQPDA